MCMFSRMTSMSLPNTKPYFVCEGTRGTAAVEKNLRRVCTWKRERLQLHGARRQARHCRGQLFCSSAPCRTPPLCIRRRDETWQSGAARRRATSSRAAPVHSHSLAPRASSPAGSKVCQAVGLFRSQRLQRGVETEAGEPGCRPHAPRAPPTYPSW
jgi:hypothetical protein